MLEERSEGWAGGRVQGVKVACADLGRRKPRERGWRKVVGWSRGSGQARGHRGGSQRGRQDLPHRDDGV